MNLLESIKATAPQKIKADIPEGWRTVFQIRDEEAKGKSIEGVRKILLDGVNQGSVLCKKFHAPYSDGKVRLLNCYTAKAATPKTPQK